MYYIWSLLVAITIFIIIQYNDYKKDPEIYNIYSYNNLGTFIIIYLTLTIIFYFIFEIDYNCLNKIQSSKSGGDSSVIENIAIDPSMLKRIPDSIYTGFTPYNSTDL